MPPKRIAIKARRECQRKADRNFSAKKVRLEVAFNTENPRDAARIEKLAAMPDKTAAVKAWLDSLDLSELIALQAN